jgi:hypothetical protein
MKSGISTESGNVSCGQKTMIGKGKYLLLFHDTVTVVFSLKNLTTWDQRYKSLRLIRTALFIFGAF